MNGTFYGSALLDQLESYARIGDPSLLLENSAERKRVRVPLMGVVDLSQDMKGETATSSGISSKEGNEDVDEGVSTYEEKMCKEPKDWRSEGPGCSERFLSSRNGSEAEAKTLMMIRAKRKKMSSDPEQREERIPEEKKQRREVARKYAQLQDLQKEDNLSLEAGF